MSIITELLKRRGIKSKEELIKEELQEFEQWETILAKEDISLKDVEEFCKIQLSITEGKFKDLDNTPQKTEKLVLLHSVYSGIRNLINSPRQERENLENYLRQLLDK